MGEWDAPAIATLNLKDQLFAPNKAPSMKFKGKDPWTKIRNNLVKIMRLACEAKSADMFERIIKWDMSLQPRKLFGWWEVYRKFDKWTGVWFKCKVKGFQHSETKIGTVSISFDGWLHTKYSYANSIQKSLWWTYNKIFYYRQRRRYLRDSHDFMKKMQDNVREMLGAGMDVTTSELREIEF